MRSTLCVVCAVLVVGTMKVSGQPVAPASPAPFPDGARIAFVDFDRVAATSQVGKAATAELDALRGKKTAEVAERRKQLEALQKKLADGASLMNTDAVGRLQREVERTGKDLERFTQDAQDEVQHLQVQLQRSFGEKVFPVIGEVAKARNVWAVYRLDPASVLWFDLALDLSEEVVAKLDGKAAPAPAAPRP